MIGRASSKNGNPVQLEGFESVAVMSDPDDDHTTVTARCPRCRLSVPIRLERREIFAQWSACREVELSTVAATLSDE